MECGRIVHYLKIVSLYCPGAGCSAYCVRYGELRLSSLSPCKYTQTGVMMKRNQEDRHNQEERCQEKDGLASRSRRLGLCPVSRRDTCSAACWMNTGLELSMTLIDIIDTDFHCKLLTETPGPHFPAPLRRAGNGENSTRR